MFEAGKPQQSLREFKKCTALEPWNLKCQIYKSLSNLNAGKFFQGVKDITQKGMLFLKNIICGHFYGVNLGFLKMLTVNNLFAIILFC